LQSLAGRITARGATHRPYALPSLLKLVSSTQVVFGTDFPFGPSGNVAEGLIDYGFGADDLRRTSATICFG
jgi:hypothetical protein